MAVLLACVTFISTGLGGLAAIRFRDRLHLLLGFSSGAVLGVVFFDVLPEVFSSASVPTYLMLAAAAGFLTFFALERYTALHRAREHPHRAEEHEAELGVLGTAGLSVHSFLDGVAIGIGFQASSRLGFIIALAMISAHAPCSTVTTSSTSGISGRPCSRPRPMCGASPPAHT